MAHRARRGRTATHAAAFVAAAGLTALSLAAPGASAAGEPRIDLRVLVVFSPPEA